MCSELSKVSKVSEVSQLSDQEGLVLVRLARQVIEEALALPATAPVTAAELRAPAFQEQRGVFVTLHKQGALRGCIGSLGGGESILAGVQRQARNAAFHDYRFPAVVAGEVGALRISVSVLTAPRPLLFKDSAELLRLLRPEVDGVILRDSHGAGATFLPQVWEQLPAPAMFLCHLCRKAGLSDDAWCCEPIEIQTYQVQYFEEGR